MKKCNLKHKCDNVISLSFENGSTPREPELGETTCSRCQFVYLACSCLLKLNVCIQVIKYQRPVPSWHPPHQNPVHPLHLIHADRNYYQGTLGREEVIKKYSPLPSMSMGRNLRYLNIDQLTSIRQ